MGIYPIAPPLDPLLHTQLSPIILTFSSRPQAPIRFFYHFTRKTVEWCLLSLIILQSCPYPTGYLHKADWTAMRFPWRVYLTPTESSEGLQRSVYILYDWTIFCPQNCLKWASNIYSFRYFCCNFKTNHQKIR